MQVGDVQVRGWAGSVDIRACMNMSYRLPLVLAALLPSLTACPAGRESEFTPAPRFCEMVRGIYCIQDAQLTLNEERSPTPSSGAVLIMYGEFWRENPAIIIEPAQCSAHISDTAEIIDYTERYSWRGEQWDRMVVRLHSGSDCDFQFLFPNGERDAEKGTDLFLRARVNDAN